MSGTVSAQAACGAADSFNDPSSFSSYGFDFAVSPASPLFEWLPDGKTPLTSRPFLLGALSCYFLVALFFERYMGRRAKPIAWVAKYAFAHNLFLAIGSAFAFCVLVARAAADGRFDSLDAFACQARKTTSTDGIIYLIYLSKMVEFADTMIMIAAKKRVHWMHRLHHLSTMGLVWHCMEAGNRAEILAAGTSLVSHVLLYGYYAFPAKTLRPLINIAQCAQFLVCLIAACVLLAIRMLASSSSPIDGAFSTSPCGGTVLAEVHGIIAFSIYLLLMGGYFWKQYMVTKRSDRAAVFSPCGQLLAPCGEEVMAPCAQAVTKLSVSVDKLREMGISGDLVDFGAIKQISIPTELFQTSKRAAFRFIGKTSLVASLGVVCLAVLPFYLSPIGWLLLGTAMSWGYAIGLNCSQGSFFSSQLANDVVGTVVLLPLLHSLDTIRKTCKDSVILGLSLPATAVATFAAFLIYMITANFGFPVLFKYWLLPLAVMHWNLRRTKSADDAPLKADQLLVPELTNLETSKSVPVAVRSALVSAAVDIERIPIYNLPGVYDALTKSAATLIKSAAADMAEIERSCAPKWLRLVREILFWRKRDAVIWVVGAFVFLLAGTGFGDYVWVPVSALLPFVFVKTAISSPKPIAYEDALKRRHTQKIAGARRSRSRSPSPARASKKAPSVASAEKSTKVDATTAETSKMLTPWQQFMTNGRWGMATYLGIAHTAALVGLWKAVSSCSWATLAWTLALWPVGALGITAGVHRLYAHKSYEAGLAYRILIMIFNSTANQGSIFHWARDHRVHHLHSETEADPHDASRGFFFAHVGWLLVKKKPEVIEAGKKIDMSDLWALPEVRLQKMLDPFWNLFFCYVAPALVAKYGWGESFINGLLVPGALRYVILLHITWCVNSYAHLYGEHPYEDINPAESPLVAIGSLGEGWHNWHHAFPYDYAASELGVSKQFNPTKLFIDISCALGFAWGRKRALKQWERRKNRLGLTEGLTGPPLFRTRVVAKPQ